MDIAARKQRLNRAADTAGRDRVAWYGDTGDTCRRCRVQVPAGYLLALPKSEVSGCLRCLEVQAHLLYDTFENLPGDLAGSGGQPDALRTIAQEFRQHIKAAERGRTPLSRQEAAARWAAQSGWESSPAWEPPEPSAKAARNGHRWPKRPLHNARQQRSNATEAAAQRRRPAPVPPLPDPAEVLGLTGTPSRAEIIAAFRRSALVCHPDYGGSAEAFRDLVAARDALLEEV